MLISHIFRMYLPTYIMYVMEEKIILNSKTCRHTASKNLYWIKTSCCLVVKKTEDLLKKENLFGEIVEQY